MNKILYLLLVAPILFCFTGCDDFLGDNRDPDAIDKVPVSQIMPVVIFYSALQNYDHAEYGTYLSLSLTTAGKAQASSYAYKGGWEFLGMNRHPQWRRHYYDLGSNANELLALAAREESYNYMAITRLLRLMSTQVTTDVFGDMPRTEAYKSSSPAYDSQESIYEWMLQEADDLIDLFDSPQVTQASNRPLDVKIDRVFAGDMNKWKHLLYAVKARILLRQIPNISTGADVCNQILESAEMALNGWTDPAYKFDGGAAVEKNCMWGRNNSPINTWESRSNQLASAIPTRFLMEEMLGYDPLTGEADDPRLPYMMEARGNETPGVDADTTYRYLEANIGMPASHKIEWYPDLYKNVLCTDESTIILLTRGELHFIVAEAAYWAGDKSKAAEHMRAGIRYHMNRLQVSSPEIDAYMNNPELVAGSSNITIGHIMRQKYIALYLQPEQWNDMRRYGYSNNDNDRRYDNTVIYQGLKRPHNLYEAYWAGNDDWLQRINYDPETEEKYNRGELIRLDAFRNPDWLKKPMIWAPQN